MSIRMCKYVDANERTFITLMNSDREKSFTLYEATRIVDIRRDFEGRVIDEQS